MAETANRKLARIRVALPSGKNVDIPVIQKGSFVVATDQYQEREVYFRNDATAERQVRVQPVPSITGEDTINVERIKKFRIKTVTEQAQETDYLVSNEDPPPIQKNGNFFPAHERVHYVRFYAGEGGADHDGWVDVELIDKLKIICPNEQYQEWQVYCRHDEPGDYISDGRVPYLVSAGTCPPNLDLLTGDGINPPYRLDPFQNIVTFAGDEESEPMAQTLGEPHFGDSAFTAAWVRTDLNPLIIEHIAAGTAYIAGSIDMRMVEQPFDPHTYEHSTGGTFTSGDTGNMHGFTQDEWDVEFNPGGLWHQQRLDFIAANPGRDPNILNDEFYPYADFLDGLSDAAWQRFIDSGNLSFNPIPYVQVRWVAIDSFGVRH